MRVAVAACLTSHIRRSTSACCTEHGGVSEWMLAGLTGPPRRERAVEQVLL